MSIILVIDDDKALCRSLQIQLEAENHSVETAGTAEAGLAQLEKHLTDIVFLDVRLPDMDGLQVLKKLKDLYPDLPVVMITGQQDMTTIIESMKAGAFDYLRKPFELGDVHILLAKIERFKRISEKTSVSQIHDPVPGTINEIIGSDKKILNVVKQIGLLARSNVDVLIEGESGTGKELVARALHNASNPEKPFIAINCSAVVPTLLESELFGHEKGAFTGADTSKTGKLEHAGEGTVFLDEIGDMAMDLQSKMLRVLQEREFERVGGLRSIAYRARTVAATNRDLESFSREGNFREDLFYRLAVTRIVVPPLRDRRGDIPGLVHHLVHRIGKKLHRNIDTIDENVMRILQNYDWPGNVRELENVLIRAISLARRNMISADDLKFSFHPEKEIITQQADIKSLHQIEKDHIRKALSFTGWNITRTAKLLEISPTTLRKKIKDYDLEK